MSGPQRCAVPIASFEDMISRTPCSAQQRLTPHDFRHCVATSIAQFDPEQIDIIRIILGHTTMATADKHYIHAKVSKPLTSCRPP